MPGSLSAALPTDPFTDAEKSDIRRFCGYPAYGNGNSGFNSHRFFTAYGVLEFRLNNFSPSEIQVVRGYLATLYALEAAIPTAGDNLDTAVAAVWTRNKNEMEDRARLFDNWCIRLVGFIGLPAGPALQSSANPTAIVV